MSLVYNFSAPEKPDYIDPAGDPSFGELTSAPPYIFRNTTARIFSLRANMAVLRGFCDQYLNMDIPPTIVHYAPALPYVYLMVLNYGSMSASSVQAQNLGWVAQHEVTFTVVLQRWRKEGDTLVFKDWATVSPFIYVDDSISLANGREVYGWNKVLGSIDSAVPLWAGDPRAPLRQFDLGVVDFASAYAGQSDEKHPLLQVELDPPPTFLEFPPNPANPWSPLWAVPNAIANTASFLGSALDTALALRLRGFEENRSPESLAAMGGQLARRLKSVLPTMQPSRPGMEDEIRLDKAIAGLPTLFVDAVTLKQFRNPEDPSLACYQALVNSKMGVDRVNRAGLLGDINLLRGDSSCGYTIKIHQLDSQPIIRTLGLMVDSWSGGEADAPGSVATIKPVLPSWLDVDLFYGKGEMICSRSPRSILSAAGPWVDEQKDTPTAKSGQFQAGRIVYNNALGAATQPVTGPFHFPDVAVQVYPLLADREKLEQVLDRFLNDHLQMTPSPGVEPMISPQGRPQKGWRFETFGSYVYMMVTVYGREFGDGWSGTNNIGGFFDREVTFCIPVKWYDESGTLISVAMVEPFTFSNDGRAVATDREVNGYNTVRAIIDSPADVWMTPNGPSLKRQLLNMQLEVIPALNLGQRARQRTLLEIDQCDALPEADSAGWRNIATGWGRDLVDELKRKTWFSNNQSDSVVAGKALGLELIAHGASLNRIIVKQYRDGEQLTKACYQAIVHATSTITSVYDVREIEPRVHVRMHRQPGNLIAEALGLKVKTQVSGGGEVVDVLEPLHPFWVRLGLKEDLATVACFRVEDGPWQIVHPWFGAPAGAGPDGVETATGASRPLEGRKSYFLQPEATPTRVGPWLARAPGDNVAGAVRIDGEARPSTPVNPIAPSAVADAAFIAPPPEVLDPASEGNGVPSGALLAPPRPTGDTLALFADAAEVNAWLRYRLTGEVTGANLHLDLKNSAQDWLRRSIINELAWIRVKMEPGIADARAQHSRIPSLASLLNCEIAPSSITAMTEQYTIQHLLSLERAAKFAFGEIIANAQAIRGDTDSSDGVRDMEQTFQANLATVLSHFQTFFDVSTAGIRERGLAWSWDDFLDGMITVQILEDSVIHFGALQQDSRLAFLMTLPKAAYPLLLASGNFINTPKYTFETTFEDYNAVSLRKIHDVKDNIQRIKILADLIESGLIDWMHPSRWRRYTRDEAAGLIDKLADVQLVIDNILASEWENRGDRARYLNPKAGRRPDEVITVEPQLEQIATDEGLQRWIDPVTAQASHLWVVPIPGASDSVAGAPLGGGYGSGPAPRSTLAADAAARDGSAPPTGDAPTG